MVRDWKLFIDLILTSFETHSEFSEYVSNKTKTNLEVPAKIFDFQAPEILFQYIFQQFL